MLYPAPGDLLFPHYLVSSSNGVYIPDIFLEQNMSVLQAHKSQEQADLNSI